VGAILFSPTLKELFDEQENRSEEGKLRSTGEIEAELKATTTSEVADEEGGNPDEFYTDQTRVRGKA